MKKICNLKEVDAEVAQRKKEQQEREQYYLHLQQQHRESEEESIRQRRQMLIDTYEQRMTSAVASRIERVRSVGAKEMTFSIGSMQLEKDTFVEEVWKKVIRDLCPAKGYLCMVNDNLLLDPTVDIAIHQYDFIVVFFYDDKNGFDVSHYASMLWLQTMLLLFMFVVCVVGVAINIINLFMDVNMDLTVNIPFWICFIVEISMVSQIYKDYKYYYPLLKKKAADASAIANKK